MAVAAIPAVAAIVCDVPSHMAVNVPHTNSRQGSASAKNMAFIRFEVDMDISTLSPMLKLRVLSERGMAAFTIISSCGLPDGWHTDLTAHPAQSAPDAIDTDSVRELMPVTMP